MITERTPIISETSLSYPDRNNQQNLNLEYDTDIAEIEEHDFDWNNIAIDIIISIILAMGIFFLIAEVHEVAHNPQVGDMRVFNNITESCYLLLTFLAIAWHLKIYRTSRNCWYSILFDNYPMLIIMCIYALIEVLYYVLNYISISTMQCFETSRLICTTMEFLFMGIMLPFSIITVKFNVRKLNISLKMKTKITIILSMVGCLFIFSRKIAIKFKKDYNNLTEIEKTCESNISADGKMIHEMCSPILNMLGIIDINYFIIAFILLLNPLLNLDRHDENMDKIEEKSPNTDQTQFSIWTWISLVRFRLISALLSLAIISVMCVSLYITIGAMNSKKLSLQTQYITMIIFLSSVTCSYVITSVYGIFYYFSNIKTWEINKKQEFKSDQYFNFLTSSSQLIYSSTMLIALLSTWASGNYNSASLLSAQIINYFFLSIQIMIQANCIHSASRRTVKKFTIDDIMTWNFRLFPSLVLASFNFVAMIVSIVYSQNPEFSNLFQELNSERLLWLFIQDLTLPLTILNRFHGMTFFIDLSIKQWQHN